MLNVLLESQAPRTRRLRSTITSALLHVLLIAAAVVVTVPEPVDANGVAPPTPPVFIVPPAVRRPTLQPAPADVSRLTERLPAPTTIAVPDVVPSTLPPIDPVAALLPDQLVLGGATVRSASPLFGGQPVTIDGVADEHFVDHAPRLIGRALEPHYPAALRHAGVNGRVVVQFVVDTLGRAELDDLAVMEAAHPLFVASVRTALERYRFTVGEAGGRKVRTRVQMRFEFLLTG